MRKKYKSYIIVKDSERNGSSRKISFLILIINLLCVSFFLGCAENSSEENHQNTTEVVPLTEEKCVNFAEQLHFSFADSNANYLESYLNWELIEEEVVMDSPLRKEIFDTLVAKYNVATDFVEMTYSGADVRFITYYKESDRHHVIFRVFDQPQSLNIYEFELQGNSNEIYIADIYDFSTAVSVTTSLKNEVDFWSQWGDTWVEKFASFEMVQKDFEEAMLVGDLKQAFLLTKQLSSEFTDLRRFRQLYGLICERSGSPELLIGYLSEEIDRIPLTEKGRWLPLFYLRSIEGNYGEALIALSNLESEVGEDVYLDFLKGNVYFEMGDYSSAVSYFNKALAVDNNVMIFHLGKIHSYISLGLYVEAVESLLVMDDSFKVSEFDWKQEFSIYPDFINSEAFKEFEDRLEQ